MAAPFMHSQPASELEALGHFSASLRLTDVPQPTVALAKLAMLNIIGGILVSDHPVLNPGRQSLLRYVQRQGAAPRARILGTRERTSPELASLVTSGSAMMAHGDDWSWPARTHLSAVVFPATLAMAEAHCRSGAELLCAFIAGTEVGVRIGSAILPVSGRKIPFTSPVHALATAASAASIMQLDASRAALALSFGGHPRAPRLPDVPSIREIVPGFDMVTWFGIVAPPGTPSDIVQWLHAEIAKALKDPQVADALNKAGYDIVGNTPAQLASVLREEAAANRQVAEKYKLGS